MGCEYDVIIDEKVESSLALHRDEDATGYLTDVMRTCVYLDRDSFSSDARGALRTLPTIRRNEWTYTSFSHMASDAFLG
jgi:hypothetical protein